MTSTEEANDNVTAINKKYGIETFSYVEEDLQQLSTRMESEMAKNSTWKREWMDEHMLIRFLRTFKTVEESVVKLTNYFNWRNEEEIDDIDIQHPVMQKLMAQRTNEIPPGFHDRFGRPIMIIYTARQTKEACNTEFIFKRAMWHIEQMCNLCDASASRNFTVIFNMDNFTMGNSDYGFLQRYFNALRDYYPDRIGAALVINYPSLVYPLWKVAKYWMNKHLRSRFIFCGKEEFNDFIDVDTMPVKLFH